MLIRIQAELAAAYTEIARLEHALCASNLLAARAEPRIIKEPAELVHIMDPKHDLTKREHDVLVEIMTGAGTIAIGKQLFMSESTVKSHLVSVYHKLGVHNRSGAAMAGVKLGLLARSDYEKQ